MKFRTSINVKTLNTMKLIGHASKGKAFQTSNMIKLCFFKWNPMRVMASDCAAAATFCPMTI